MPKLNMTVSHNLTQDEAVERIRNLLNDVKTEFAEKVSDLNEDWNGNTGRFSFKAMGFPVSGTLMVKPGTVEISGNLPFAALLFKSKIETVIKDRAKTLLA